MKHIVGFSGGIDSQACARWVLTIARAAKVNMDSANDDTLEAMRSYGGSFVRALAEAYARADAANQERLRAAFPEVWTEYAALVVLQRERDRR